MLVSGWTTRLFKRSNHPRLAWKFSLGKKNLREQLVLPEVLLQCGASFLIKGLPLSRYTRLQMTNFYWRLLSL